MTKKYLRLLSLLCLNILQTTSMELERPEEVGDLVIPAAAGGIGFIVAQLNLPVVDTSQVNRHNFDNSADYKQRVRELARSRDSRGDTVIRDVHAAVDTIIYDKVIECEGDMYYLHDRYREVEKQYLNALPYYQHNGIIIAGQSNRDKLYDALLQLHYRNVLELGMIRAFCFEKEILYREQYMEQDRNSFIYILDNAIAYSLRKIKVLNRDPMPNSSEIALIKEIQKFFKTYKQVINSIPYNLSNAESNTPLKGWRYLGILLEYIEAQEKNLKTLEMFFKSDSIDAAVKYFLQADPHVLSFGDHYKNLNKYLDELKKKRDEGIFSTDDIAELTRLRMQISTEKSLLRIRLKEMIDTALMSLLVQVDNLYFSSLSGGLMKISRSLIPLDI